MNQEFDEEVKESMKWFTEDVEVPAGLAAQARDQVRRQRRTRMSWIASGTAVAAVAAVVIGAVGTGGPGAAGSRPNRAQRPPAALPACLLPAPGIVRQEHGPEG